MDLVGKLNSIKEIQAGKPNYFFLKSIFFLLLHRQVISVQEREIGTKHIRISLHDTNLTLLNYRYLVAKNLIFLFWALRK